LHLLAMFARILLLKTQSVIRICTCRESVLVNHNMVEERGKAPVQGESLPGPGHEH
jgi:hypothetical protein